MKKYKIVRGSSKSTEKSGKEQKSQKKSLEKYKEVRKSWEKSESRK